MQTATLAHKNAPVANQSANTKRARLALVPRPRLKLGRAGDEAEHQADRIAAHALGASTRARAIPPAAPGSGPAAVRRALVGGTPAAEDRSAETLLPEALEERLVALQSGGTPLPAALRTEMEARFGLDFGPVRIHTDGEAAELTEAVGAHAFALGEHIAFNRGRFAPEKAGGRHLLAHELAHVAQHRAQAGALEQAPVRRGFWGDLYDSVADTLGDIAEWGMDKIREFGWKLIRSISPELERTLRSILDEGILPWLGRQVARAWDAYIGTLKALVPFEGPRQLIDLFAGLVERAAGIVAALASGNCEPLMAAIGEMKAFVVETVGVAWDKLTEFLRPIGEFFGELWTNFGAPAVQWLQDFGGAAWEGIQELGRRFWEWIRPVREAAERIWNWFHDLLFGSSEGDEAGSSQGGVVGWISTKAGEAWDWVKERTRPVWQPVAEFAGKVAELIPPAFIREMGEHAKQLSTELDGAGDGMEGGEGVPENRDTLASVLPSVERIISTVRRIIAGAGEWLASRVGAIAGLVTSLIGRLNANSLLSWLGGALSWLAELTDALASWARDKVNTLFNWLLGAFDYLTPFFELVLNTVKKVITIYGDLLQLPLLVLNSIWQKVPACIREPIENFIQTQILARIPVFGQFFSDPEWWPKLKQTALRLLRRIFVDGDILGVAWDFFKAVLRLMGLPPELVVQVLAKALAAIGEILVNPIGFLINLLRAMGKGFLDFFKNIGKHLFNGITGWLFGAVREAGIEPPADFSLGSVFKFVMAVLGVTIENVFARLKRKIDPVIVERIKGMLAFATGVWNFVAVLLSEGVSGLWRLLSEKLSNLWTVVLQGVTSFITTRVIAWASLWLVSLLDWSGITPTINTLIAIYRAIQAAIEYLRQMLEIVSSFLDGVLAIASGAIETAAAFLEDTLARSLPVAIGFLAYQAGLGRLSQRLQEILGGLRDRVNAAIDWLIDQAIKFGKALIDMAKRGVAAVKSGARRLREWWRERIGFRAADGKDHALYFRGQGATAELIIESDPQGFQTFLRNLPASADQADKAEAQRLFTELQRIQKVAPPTPPGGTAAANPTGAGVGSNDAEILSLTQQLANVAARLMGPGGAVPNSTPPRYDGLSNGYGKGVTVDLLTSKKAPGSEPSVESAGWNVLNRRMTGEGNYYVRGHLLNHFLGGSGYSWANLTPITGSANTTMSSQVEEKAKDAVDGGAIIHYAVRAAYPRNLGKNRALLAQILHNRAGGPLPADVAAKKEVIEAEQALPETIFCTLKKVDASGKEDTSFADRKDNFPIPNTIRDDSLDDYTIDGVDYDPAAELRSLSTAARTELGANTALTWTDFRTSNATRIEHMTRAGTPDDTLRAIFREHHLGRSFDAEQARIAALDAPTTWLQFIDDRVAFKTERSDDERFSDSQIAALRSAFDARMVNVAVARTLELIGIAEALGSSESWRSFRDRMGIAKLPPESAAQVRAAFDARMSTLASSAAATSS